MSKIYRKENENRENSSKFLGWSIVLAIPVILAFISFFATGSRGSWGLYVLAIIFFGAPSSFLYNRYKSLRSGVNGEERLHRVLTALNDDYSVITNVPIDFQGKRTELDALVVGKNGVFIIEVKNHNGTIVGDGEEDIWIQHKVGRKGGRYTKNMKNPMKQVSFQVYLLSQYLKSKNINVWVDGMVYFSSYEVKSCVVNAEKVFFDYEEVIDRISNTIPRRELNDDIINDIVKSFV